MQIKCLIFLLGVVLVVTAGFKVTFAQDNSVEPPLDLPLTSATAIATATTDTSAFDSYVGATATATVASYTQSAEDEADTGAEVYILIGISLVAGFGFYCLKRYFDYKRYMI